MQNRVATQPASRIMQLKGDMTFIEMSNAIFGKTGARISANGLQHLASGVNKQGRLETIAILAEYSDHPISWFYEEDQPEQVHEQREAYTVGTQAHKHMDELLRLHRAAEMIEDEDSLNKLANIAELFAEKERKEANNNGK